MAASKKLMFSAGTREIAPIWHPSSGAGDTCASIFVWKFSTCAEVTVKIWHIRLVPIAGNSTGFDRRQCEAPENLLSECHAAELSFIAGDVLNYLHQSQLKMFGMNIAQQMISLRWRDPPSLCPRALLSAANGALAGDYGK